MGSGIGLIVKYLQLIVKLNAFLVGDYLTNRGKNSIVQIIMGYESRAINFEIALIRSRRGGLNLPSQLLSLTLSASLLIACNNPLNSARAQANESFVQNSDSEAVTPPATSVDSALNLDDPSVLSILDPNGSARFISKPEKPMYPAQVSSNAIVQRINFMSPELAIYSYVAGSSNTDLGEFRYEYDTQNQIAVHTQPDILSPRTLVDPDELYQQSRGEAALTFGKHYSIFDRKNCSFFAYYTNLRKTGGEIELGALWYVLLRDNQLNYVLPVNVKPVNPEKMVSPTPAATGIPQKILVDQLKAPSC